MTTERRDANGVSPVTERVARGAALLDEKRPDWWMSVNPHVLDMAACDACVLGQLYGDYHEALSVHMLRAWRHPWEYGFNHNLQTDAVFSSNRADLMAAEYADLRTEWVSVINDRRARRYLKGESK